MKKILLPLILVVSVLPLLQGCFPIFATGVVGTGLVVTDRRTSGAQLEDEGIELRANHAVSDKFGDKVHVNANSFNRNLLLTGEAPDQTTRKAVEAVVHAVPNIRSVINEIAIAGNSSFSERAADAFTTTKVRTRLFTEANNQFIPVQISITTEAGVVYLMGLETHAEGDAASALASTTSGVRRVVKVFEYIPKIPDNEKSATPSADAAKTSAPAKTDKPVEVQPPAPQSDVLPPAQAIK
jgi:osmotically-inducible protein OsmY